MSIFYHIRPKNNGTVKLGITKQGEYVEIPKGAPGFDNQILLFKTEEEAQAYIKKNNLLDKGYMSEWTWRSNEFICPCCGSSLQVEMVVEAAKSQSGCTERLCSCRNDYCLADWNLITDENDKVIKIERYFVG